VKAAARVVDAAERGVGVRLLVIGEEVVTDAMAIKVTVKTPINYTA